MCKFSQTFLGYVSDIILYGLIHFFVESVTLCLINFKIVSAWTWFFIGMSVEPSL